MICIHCRKPLHEHFAFASLIFCVPTRWAKFLKILFPMMAMRVTQYQPMNNLEFLEWKDATSKSR